MVSKNECLQGAQLIVSSPYTRALQTASIISRAVDIPLQVEMELHEWLPDLNYCNKYEEEEIISNDFSYEDADFILNKLLENGIFPMVHAFLGETEKYLFDEKHMSRGMADFQSKREQDERRTPVDVYDLDPYDVFYFTCIDDEDKLKSLYEELRSSYQCLFTKDIYSGDYWLEILPNKATKASAIRELKALLGCDKVVCFGDGTNDIAMFKDADECYAVSNAHPDLKKLATAIIGTNENDGVAKWLLENFKE